MENDGWTWLKQEKPWDEITSEWCRPKNEQPIGPMESAEFFRRFGIAAYDSVLAM